METLIRWFEQAEAHAAPLLGLSVAMLLLTIVVFPFVIARLPSDYFADDSRPPPLSRHLIVHVLLMALKNLLGLALVLVGVLLFFLPGQGLLTLLIGLTIMNYPGKFEVERWLVRRPRVLPALNWLRARFGAVPFVDP
jgi:Putative transmembrane protein (PGPGW)